MTDWINRLAVNTPGEKIVRNKDEELISIYLTWSFELFDMFYDLSKKIKKALPHATGILCTDNSIKIRLQDISIELINHGISKESAEPTMEIIVIENQKNYKYKVVLKKNTHYHWAVRTGPGNTTVELTATVLENIFKNALARYISDTPNTDRFK